jgi:hypothetical protein
MKNQDIVPQDDRRLRQSTALDRALHGISRQTIEARHKNVWPVDDMLRCWRESRAEEPT